MNIQDIQHEAAFHVGLPKNKALYRTFEILKRFACRQAQKISVIADGFTENMPNKGVPAGKIMMILKGGCGFYPPSV